RLTSTRDEVDLSTRPAPPVFGYCCEEEEEEEGTATVARRARFCITYRTPPRTPHAIATLTRPDNARKVARMRKAAIACAAPMKPFGIRKRHHRAPQPEYRYSCAPTSTALNPHRPRPARARTQGMSDVAALQDRRTYTRATLQFVEVVRDD